MKETDLPHGFPCRGIIARALPISLWFSLAFFIVAMILSFTADASCYILTSADGATISRASLPPFDISAPGMSTSYEASRARGERLLIKPGACGAGGSALNVKAVIPAMHDTDAMRAAQAMPIMLPRHAEPSVSARPVIDDTVFEPNLSLVDATKPMALAMRMAVQAAGYTCDTIRAVQPCLWGCDAKLTCNQNRYTFEFTDVGGKIEIVAKR